MLPVSDAGTSGICIAKDSSWGEGTSTLNRTYHGISGSPATTSIAFLKSQDADTQDSGNASPATDSQLSNVTLKYTDVIAAIKD